MPRLEGAYSTVVMTKHAVVAFRDPHGVRPLALGKMKPWTASRSASWSPRRAAPSTSSARR